jgi:hypothetical protein
VAIRSGGDKPLLAVAELNLQVAPEVGTVRADERRFKQILLGTASWSGACTSSWRKWSA